jgi:DNA-binding CsgD family transcriptional regulator
VLSKQKLALTVPSGHSRKGRTEAQRVKHNNPKRALTVRQTECLRLVRAGCSSVRIGQALGISSDVVDEHIAKACKRLRIRTRAQAVLVASLTGLL